MLDWNSKVGASFAMPCYRLQWSCMPIAVGSSGRRVEEELKKIKRLFCFRSDTVFCLFMAVVLRAKDGNRSELRYGHGWTRWCAKSCHGLFQVFSSTFLFSKKGALCHVTGVSRIWSDCGPTSYVVEVHQLVRFLVTIKQNVNMRWASRVGPQVPNKMSPNSFTVLFKF